MKDIRVDIINEGDLHGGYVKVNWIIELLAEHTTDLQKRVEGLKEYDLNMLSSPARTLKILTRNVTIDDVLSLLDEEGGTHE